LKTDIRCGFPDFSFLLVFVKPQYQVNKNKCQLGFLS
jgi:hypothetical protein